MLLNPKGFIKLFLRFQAPNTIPTYFHYSQTTTTLQSILLISTIYQGLLIFLLPKKVVGARYFKIWVENNVRKKKSKMIRLFSFKEEEGGSPLDGQWKEKVLMLEGQWKEKEKVLFHLFSLFP